MTEAVKEGWRKVRLGEVCKLMSSGGTPSRRNPLFFKNGSFLWVKSQELRDKSIYDTEEKITEEALRKSSAKSYPVNTILLAMYGATVGKLGILKVSSTINQAICGMVVNEQVADYRFLFYLLLFKRGDLIAKAFGAAQQNLNQDLIKNFDILLPPLHIQRRIAAILSAYDDLIENNTRRIKILEEMAQTIYKEWFVKFRFPGYDKVKLVDSELGPIPEGWEVMRLSTLVDPQYGYTESASEDEVGPKYVRGTDINKTSYIQWDSVPYCPINEANHTKFKLVVGDILVIRMADPGKGGIVEKGIDAVFASYLIRLHIKSNSLSPYYLFYFLLSDRYQDYVTGASTGTTRKSASAGVITDIDIIIPANNICEQFEKEISTIRLMLNKLLDKNAILRRTHDLLLPKLISGEVDVTALDLTMEGSKV